MREGMGMRSDIEEKIGLCLRANFKSSNFHNWDGKKR